MGAKPKLALYPTWKAGHSPREMRSFRSALSRSQINWRRWAWWALSLFAFSVHAAGTNRPNILLLLADDLGFSDLGCYGGEIATTNLDALAQDGLRFTQFYNTARCWPSRAAILTGYYAQEVRRDEVAGVSSGMRGQRPAWAPLLSERLHELGYRTYHSGKWHLDGQPLKNGFDHSYSLNDHDRYFAPQLHTEDDQPLPPVRPGTGYYATTAIADHAIKCLKEHATAHAHQPFFSFVAFTSPHFPVQAPVEDIARYHDRYLEGWDALRQGRWTRMQAMGIGGSALAAIERNVGPPYAFPDALKQLGPNEVNRAVAWDDLNPAQRRFQADKMSVHAAMVDRMDQEIGRILAQVRAMGAAEDTLVLFLSDNGASAEMMVRGDGHDPEAVCGTGATFLSIGPGWSSLANSPFRRHKTWVHEGGISTPLIVSWPHGISDHGKLRRTPAHVVDLVPTLLEVAGAASTFPSSAPAPRPPGLSLVPLLARDGAVQHETLWWQHEGNRALRRGNWKIVAAGEKSAWELYDVTTDRSEAHNLAAEKPDLVQQLAARWQQEAVDYSEIARRDPLSPFPQWKHFAILHVLTTAEGANLPATAELEGFPLLVRLHRDYFNFRQAKLHGEDIRFTTAAGVSLPYEIADWDATMGEAAIWVRIPMVRGQEQRELRVYWGNDKVGLENLPVFDASNGYLSVWHLGGVVRDDTGTLESKDEGTTSVPGVVGMARHFAGGQGIACGESIANYPSGNAPHSTEAWVRLDRANTTLIGWGNEGGGRGSKVRMQVRSPAHLHIDSDFCDVAGASRLPMGEWTHVLHAYDGHEGRVYINGKLDGTATRRMDIKSPARLWIGGWYGNYDFVGDMDEARVSHVARSADWARMEYENQKPLQTAVGMLEQPGNRFSVSPAQATVAEGSSVTFHADVAGVRKLYWTIKCGGAETLLAVDRTQFVYAPGRFTGDQEAVLQVKAVLADGVKTQDIPIKQVEAIPDPAFTLKAPARWDGRTPLDIKVKLDNEPAMEEHGTANLHWTWAVSNLATIHEVHDGTLRLIRSQNSGPLTLTAIVNNGGQTVSHSVTIQVTEPETDPWIERVPGPIELPEDNQFYARNDRNEGRLIANGIATKSGQLQLRIFADGKRFSRKTLQVKEGEKYSFSVPLKPGLIHYSMEVGWETEHPFRPIHSATNLVCGDAFILQGQSNAVATDWGDEEPTFHSEWIRTFGGMSGDPNMVGGWGEAVHRHRDDERLQIGYWGMELARRLIDAEKVPVCILNGAVGGTRIDQHQRNPTNSTDTTTIYGRLLWRAREARLTHGIRGILWYQGENDQGADGPSGGYGWENYRCDFIALASAWKQDFPNIQSYHVFQIWPKACSMGFGDSDNRLREVQRELPTAFSHLSLMSVVGVEPPGTCHFPSAGYADIARLIFPVIERDHYKRKFAAPVTPPNLERARFLDATRQTIELEFDQPVIWKNGVEDNLYLNGKPIGMIEGIAVGNRLVIKRIVTGNAATIGYIDGGSWNLAHLLRGANGIAALTFWEVPIASGAFKKQAPTSP